MNLVGFMQHAEKTGENIYFKLQKIEITEWEKMTLPLRQLNEEETEAITLNWVVTRCLRRSEIKI